MAKSINFVKPFKTYLPKLMYFLKSVDENTNLIFVYHTNSFDANTDSHEVMKIRLHVKV